MFFKQKKFEQAVLSGEYSMDDIEYSSYYKDSFKRLKKNKMAMFCAIIVILLVLIAIFAPMIAPYDPDVQDYASILQSPSKAHLLGTDEYGRDILSRIIYGTRVSLSVGLLAQVLATLIGVTLGALAAYYGGWVDTLISRIMEIFAAFPDLIFAMGIMFVIGPGIKNIFIALGPRSDFTAEREGVCGGGEGQRRYSLPYNYKAFDSELYFYSHRSCNPRYSECDHVRSFFKLPRTGYPAADSELGFYD